MDTQGQCNLIRKKFYCKTYKKYIHTIYTMYNLKIYKLHDIYIYMTSLLSVEYIGGF